MAWLPSKQESWPDCLQARPRHLVFESLCLADQLTLVQTQEVQTHCQLFGWRRLNFVQAKEVHAACTSKHMYAHIAPLHRS